jgi:hypothetical protein
VQSNLWKMLSIDVSMLTMAVMPSICANMQHVCTILPAAQVDVQRSVIREAARKGSLGFYLEAYSL